MKNRLAAVIIACLGIVSSAGAADFGIGVEFSDDEIRIINAWYRDHGGSSYQGGGKGKHKGLPPGIAKNLQRGKPLPPSSSCRPDSSAPSRHRRRATSGSSLTAASCLSRSRHRSSTTS